MVTIEYLKKRQEITETTLTAVMRNISFGHKPSALKHVFVEMQADLKALEYEYKHGGGLV